MAVRFLSFLAGFAALVSFSVTAYAAPSGLVDLPSTSLFEVNSGGVSYICGDLSPWQVGRMLRGKFYPTSSEIRDLRSRRRAVESSVKKSELAARISSLQSYRSAGTPVCRSGPPPTGSKFDAAGNVTAAGKIAFGIPASMSANANSGIAAWNNTCKGCHLGYPIFPLRTYPEIRARIQLDPMYFQVPTEVTEQQLVDITAFRNFLN